MLQSRGLQGSRKLVKRFHLEFGKAQLHVTATEQPGVFAVFLGILGKVLHEVQVGILPLFFRKDQLGHELVGLVRQGHDVGLHAIVELGQLVLHLFCRPLHHHTFLWTGEGAELFLDRALRLELVHPHAFEIHGVREYSNHAWIDRINDPRNHPFRLFVAPGVDGLRRRGHFLHVGPKDVGHGAGVRLFHAVFDPHGVGNVKRGVGISRFHREQQISDRFHGFSVSEPASQQFLEFLQVIAPFCRTRRGHGEGTIDADGRHERVFLVEESQDRQSHAIHVLRFRVPFVGACSLRSRSHRPGVRRFADGQALELPCTAFCGPFGHVPLLLCVPVRSGDTQPWMDAPLSRGCERHARQERHDHQQHEPGHAWSSLSRHDASFGRPCATRDASAGSPSPLLSKNGLRIDACSSKRVLRSDVRARVLGICRARSTFRGGLDGDRSDRKGLRSGSNRTRPPFPDRRSKDRTGSTPVPLPCAAQESPLRI
eukprot:scaffold772_cov339-Pavlova_lutheri.AAC.57